MLSKSISLVLGLVVVIAAVSQADKELYYLCQDLNDKLELASGEVAYDIAIKHFSSPWNFMSKWRRLLSQAWKAVYEKEPCDQNFPMYIVAIEKCMGSNGRNLPLNLLNQTREYVANCSNGSVWTAALDDALKSMKKADREAVSDFLDEDFLVKYYEDNKKVDRNDFRDWKHCCRGAIAGRPAFDALNAQYKSKNKAIQWSPELIELELKKLILKPCDSYVRAMAELYRAFKATQLFRGFGGVGQQSTQTKEYFEYLQSFPEEFKDAISRYKFCSNFKVWETDFVTAVVKRDEENASHLASRGTLKLSRLQVERIK